jgi:hypothetical protein
MSSDASKGRVSEVFAAFLKLGLTSFGGPIAVCTENLGPTIVVMKSAKDGA